MRSAAWKTARSLFSCVLLAAVAAVTGCGRPVDEPQTGWYRATLELPGGETPFGLEVAQENNRFVLYLVNAAERTRVDDVTLADDELIAVFPGYENSLRAKMYRNRLQGTVTLIEDQGQQQLIPFQARRDVTYRFYEESLTDNADIAGRWEMTLTSDGKRSAAVAIFEQRHDRVTGTVLTPAGDHRFLEGQVRDDEARLSTFAGGLAYLYKLEVNEQGDLEGDLWQGLASHSTVEARRNEDARLDNSTPAAAAAPPPI